LEGVQTNFGKAPNIFKIMANSSAELDSALKFMNSWAGGVLSKNFREQFALCVGEANGCDYCLSAHTALGKKAGLMENEIYNSRSGKSSSEKVQTALCFVRKIIEKRGWVSDKDLEVVREVGYNDEEITEIIANIALHNFTNYLNHIAETEVDFPLAPKLDS